MPNHPNRGPKGPSSNPNPEEIRAAREAAGISQSAAGAIVHANLRSWQKWEAGDRRMHPAFWELFRLKLRESQEHTKAAQ
jgi:putative transcriptional regulator